MTREKTEKGKKERRRGVKIYEGIRIKRKKTHKDIIEQG